ncbi:hypothetical protein DICVIV_10715 [Dictyocaulus viviparus]|uniref:Uncharacterized protein n=1 Tax=Dictyocaulus viviparus TaxID=29172 RepID=A0A0D8XHN0_DICVI|nr:hypothetical protein DICVIV_10715 [Dictyocaulus viviparus]
MLVEKLRSDIENLRRQSEFGFERETKVDHGKSYDTHYIFGARHRGANVSAFCGELTRNHLKDVPIRRREAVIFKPAQDLPNGLTNVMVSIPRMWFRDIQKGDKLPDVPILFCYEGLNFLRLLPLIIYQSDLQANGDFMEYRHATLTADAYHEKKRHVITRACTPSLLRNQECCLWQYRSVLTVHGNKKEIVFNRCVGKIPVEETNFPFVGESHEKIAKQGGMSRRLFVPVPNVIKKECRESQFKPYQFIINDPMHGQLNSGSLGCNRMRDILLIKVDHNNKNTNHYRFLLNIKVF